MPDMSGFVELSPEKFRLLTDNEKARYLLKLPEKVPSNGSKDLWNKCREVAIQRYLIRNTASFWEDLKEKAERELAEKAAQMPTEAELNDMSRYTEGGRFDALKFCTDRRQLKTTWEGHILSAEDVETARQELAKGTSRAAVHDIIKKRQQERQKAQTQKQADFINRQRGDQPYCPLCMNRGFFAVVENDVFIAQRPCKCTLAREKAIDEKKKAEQENKNKKRGGKQHETV